MQRKAAPAAEAAALDPDRLFAGLAGARGLVLAISGGPDSTALLLLAARWRGRPPVLAVSVDHAIRAESAAEAALAAGNAEKLGLPWRIMRAPQRPAGAGNLQDWARRARYRCLASAAEAAGFDTIVTAHHQDDQAETFLLRLARGSGVYGLAAMELEAPLDEELGAGLKLARPLLDIPRVRLWQIGAESGLHTVEDPSNSDPRFDRVRLRTIMPALAEHGLTAERLAATAVRLGRAAAALDHYAHALLKGHFTADSFGAVGGPAAAFAEAPEEVGLRSLALVLQAVGGADYTPRLDRLEALRIAILEVEARGALKRTLHGAAVSVAGGRLEFRREWGRSGIAAVPVRPGSVLLWDRRFRVKVPDVAGILAVGPLGRADRKLAAGQESRSGLRTLPGLYRDGRLVAAPQGIAAADAGDPLDRLAAECVVGRRLGLDPGPGVKPFP